MMKIAAKDLSLGYNKIVTKEAHPQMNMDYGVLKLEAGGTFSETSKGETNYALISGEVEFTFDGQTKTAVRDNPFHHNPILLRVATGADVQIKAVKDSEVAIVSTDNAHTFASEFIGEEDLLQASELRGEGLMRDASTRVVRTYYDRSNKPETNFFLGEVVSYPGKWSSFPPHRHVEPEIYYYRFLPEDGYGLGEFGNDAYKIQNGDTQIMVGDSHSQCTTPGYAEWYLWIIRLRDDHPMETLNIEQYQWVNNPDAKFFPEI
ncbi:MAG: 5-deoxy-glucuronate isomerase [Clostridiales Family XIII bacterium]|jgi:5-deoxy-glucuronate isomerase|nr:5-deoxy-glucuronate isomerase [Clostridiales Family XIII bacterium]